MEDEVDHIYKVVIIGDSKTGKTNIQSRVGGHEYIPTY